MYYNKLTGRLILDLFDFFLISSFITSSLASYLKNYLSEKASMERLKKDIIKKSRLIKPSKATKSLTNLNSQESKIQKVYKFALNNRGGSDYDYEYNCDYEYKLADRITDIVIKLAVFLKEKEHRAKVLKAIFAQGRLALELVLSVCNIKLEYLVIESVSPQVAVIACCTGGMAGFVFSWFSVGAILATPPSLLSIFLLRSWYQQVQHNGEYTKFKNSVRRLFKDENFQEEMRNLAIETQKQVENSKKIKLEHLNWNKNPAIKEAAERLGIFKNAPSVHEPLTLDPDLKKILEEFGLIETPNPKTLIKTSIKGKTVNFRDFIEETVGGDNKSDLDIIDAEIVKEPLRIRIKD